MARITALRARMCKTHRVFVDFYFCIDPNVFMRVLRRPFCVLYTFVSLCARKLDAYTF